VAGAAAAAAGAARRAVRVKKNPWSCRIRGIDAVADGDLMLLN
jgi:hypothetical protein